MKKPKTEQAMYYKILRAQHNLSIEDVASACETSEKSVWRFENSQYKRVTKEIEKLMDYYYNLHKTIIEREVK